jgi:hypothetical protein
MSSMLDAYVRVAQKLGLRLEPAIPERKTQRLVLDGVVDGVVVHQERAIQRRAKGAVSWAPHLLTTRAGIDPPLGLGLELARTGFGDRIGSLFGHERQRTGDAAFDAVFTTHARDAARLPLVLTPELKGHLMHLNAADIELTLADDHVELRRWYEPADDDRDDLIEAQIRSAVLFVHKVNEARRSGGGAVVEAGTLASIVARRETLYRAPKDAVLTATRTVLEGLPGAQVDLVPQTSFCLLLSSGGGANSATVEGVDVDGGTRLIVEIRVDRGASRGDWGPELWGRAVDGWLFRIWQELGRLYTASPWATGHAADPPAGAPPVYAAGARVAAVAHDGRPYWGTLRCMESGRALVTFDNGVEQWVDAHAVHPAA